QSEGTYIADVVMPLLRVSLEDMPYGSICLSSKFRRNLGENPPGPLPQLDVEYV
ncbi:24431_t:CDS:2, partial [Gigaspora rosea]